MPSPSDVERRQHLLADLVAAGSDPRPDRRRRGAVLDAGLDDSRRQPAPAAVQHRHAAAGRRPRSAGSRRRRPAARARARPCDARRPRAARSPPSRKAAGTAGRCERRSRPRGPGGRSPRGRGRARAAAAVRARFSRTAAASSPVSTPRLRLSQGFGLTPPRRVVKAAVAPGSSACSHRTPLCSRQITGRRSQIRPASRIAPRATSSSAAGSASRRPSIRAARAALRPMPIAGSLRDPRLDQP